MTDTLSAATGLMDQQKKSIPFQLRVTETWLERMALFADQEQLSIAGLIRNQMSKQADAAGIPKNPKSSTKRKPKGN